MIYQLIVNTEKYGSKKRREGGTGTKNMERTTSKYKKKKHPLGNSRNILNHGQVQLASAKCALVFRNYGNSFVVREVYRYFGTFEKQL